MQNIIKRTIIVTLAIVVYITVVGFVLSFLMPKKGDVIKIDCTWSEISPDFSPEMKDACRKARMTKLT